jgi:hypothetical protein
LRSWLGRYSEAFAIDLVENGVAAAAQQSVPDFSAEFLGIVSLS